MRVLQINAVYGVSSTGRTTAQCHEYMRSHGIESYTACPRGDADYIIGSRLSQNVHSLLARITGREGCFSRAATRALIKYIEKLSPDVVCLRNLHSNYVSLPMLLGYLAKKNIPTVAVLHDAWFYTGKCMHYAKNGCYGWQGDCAGCHEPENAVPYWGSPCSAKQLKMKRELFCRIPRLAVVGVSDWITDEARKSILGNAGIIKRIYNFVDEAVFAPREGERKGLSLPEDKKIIFTCASRFDATKGTQGYSRLMQELGEDYLLVLAGDIPDIEISHGMIAVGNITDTAELARYYNAADVFLSLSPQESFGKAMAEALMCGVPVVGSHITACPEVAQGCGASVDVGDIPAVARAVRRICADGKEKWRDKCRKKAQENFSAEKNLREYIDLFRAISEKGTESQ